MLAPTNSKTNIKFFSLGFRCTCSGILKASGLKTESFPFDWLVSNINVIRHCIETDFAFFLDKSNYTKKNTITSDNTRNNIWIHIANETIIYNHFYQYIFGATAEPNETYDYVLAINHRNFLEKDEDYEYYKRCITRFRNLLKSDDKKMFLHITHRLNSIEEFNTKKHDILCNLLLFNEFMKTRTNNISGIYFIVVKDKSHTPNLKEIIEPIDILENSHYIYLLKANPDLLEGGEIYSGDYERERKEIDKIIQHFIH